MAKPYSADLRTRVTAAICDGQTCCSIAELFDIAPSTIENASRHGAKLRHREQRSDFGR